MGDNFSRKTLQKHPPFLSFLCPLFFFRFTKKNHDWFKYILNQCFGFPKNISNICAWNFAQPFP